MSLQNKVLEKSNSCDVCTRSPVVTSAKQTKKSLLVVCVDLNYDGNIFLARIVYVTIWQILPWFANLYYVRILAAVIVTEFLQQCMRSPQLALIC
jgi:hypothetical protein